MMREAVPIWRARIAFSPSAPRECPDWRLTLILRENTYTGYPVALKGLDMKLSTTMLDGNFACVGFCLNPFPAAPAWGQVGFGTCS